MVLRNDLLERLRADTAAAAPDWSPRPTDPVTGALSATATILSDSFLYFAMRERAAFVQTSTGADLDALAAGRGLTRAAGETDIALRQRVIDALALIQPVGSFDQLEAAARSAPQAQGFAVAQALAQPNYDTGLTTVYLLRADSGATQGGAGLPGTPTAAMVAAVQSYITARRRLPVANRYTVSATTPITEYTIAATVEQDGSSTTVEDDVRAAVYSFIDANRRMGRGIRRGLLSGAIFGVSGVTDVTITAPAADLAATGAADLIARTAFSCRKDATNVALTFNLVVPSG